MPLRSARYFISSTVYVIDVVVPSFLRCFVASFVVLDSLLRSLFVVRRSSFVVRRSSFVVGGVDLVLLPGDLQLVATRDDSDNCCGLIWYFSTVHRVYIHRLGYCLDAVLRRESGRRDSERTLACGNRRSGRGVPWNNFFVTCNLRSDADAVGLPFEVRDVEASPLCPRLKSSAAWYPPGP